MTAWGSINPGDGEEAGLRIAVMRHRGQTMPEAPGFDFDRHGGRIGRDPDCELALADAERHLSRLQARIEHDGRSFVLLDCGSNPTRVDGRPLGRGNRTALHGGESLLIGPYELLVERIATPPALPAPGYCSPQAHDPLGLFEAGPDQHEDLARLCAPPRESPQQVFQAGDDPFAVFASVSVASDGAGQLKPLAQVLAGRAVDDHDSLDPLLALGLAGVSARGDVPAPQRDDAPLLAQAFAVPRPLDTGCADHEAWSQVSRSVTTPTLGPVAGAGVCELVQAFERGLGLALALGREPTPERMEQAGAALRAAMQSTLEQFRIRLCERIAQQQAESSRQAGEEFERLFGRELSRAYDELVRDPCGQVMERRARIFP